MTPVRAPVVTGQAPPEKAAAQAGELEPVRGSGFLVAAITGEVRSKSHRFGRHQLMSLCCFLIAAGPRGPLRETGSRGGSHADEQSSDVPDAAGQPAA